MIHPIRRAAIAAVAVAAAAGMLSTTALAQQASAKPAAPAVPTNFNLNAVGSDTVYCVMGGSVADPAHDVALTKGIIATYNAAVAGTSGNTVYNTPPFPGISLGCATTPATTSVPADSQHGVLNFTAAGASTCLAADQPSPGWQDPAGSGAGITCLTTDAGLGNVAFARSSKGKAGLNPALEFWAYALDAVTWSHPAANTFAPASLTPAQLTAIYNCQITDWNTVNPAAPVGSTIARYYPQGGSGTGDFFGKTELNGFRPSNLPPGPGPCGLWSSSNPNGIHFVPENDGTQIAPADVANAILPYSYGVWKAQASAADLERDLRNGSVLAQVSGTAPSSTTISEAAAKTNVTSNACLAPVAGQFCASRYVYDVTWSAANTASGLPVPYYNAVIDLIGVPHTGAADVPGINSICSGKYKAIITKYGFKPLAKATTLQPGGPTAVTGKSFCREF